VLFLLVHTADFAVSVGIRLPGRVHQPTAHRLSRLLPSTPGIQGFIKLNQMGV